MNIMKAEKMLRSKQGAVKANQIKTVVGEITLCLNIYFNM